jgi:tRNA A-37 threonylcarbamoyl transferase component Bud32
MRTKLDKPIRQLSAGCFGYTDLYEISGIFYVLKTQKVLKTDIVEVKVAGKQKYKFAKNSRFRAELLFFAWVAKLQKSQKKYFMELVDAEIVKTKNFDTARLQNCTSEIFAKLRASKYVYKSLLTFAGNTIYSYIENYLIEYFISSGKMLSEHEKFFAQVYNDMRAIIELTRKAGFIIGDFHTENICWNNENVVLIDYGGIKIVKELENPYFIRCNKINYDLLAILKFVCAQDFYNNQVGRYHYDGMQNVVYCMGAKQAKCWPSIKHWLLKIYAGTDIGENGLVAKILHDVDNDVFIDTELIFVHELMRILWNILDANSYFDFLASKKALQLTRGLSMQLPLLANVNLEVLYKHF